MNFPFRPVAVPDPPEGADVTGGGVETVVVVVAVVTGGGACVVVGAALPGKHLQRRLRRYVVENIVAQ